jgi:hypothetical protein
LAESLIPFLEMRAKENGNKGKEMGMKKERKNLVLNKFCRCFSNYFNENPITIGLSDCLL